MLPFSGRCCFLELKTSSFIILTCLFDLALCVGEDVAELSEDAAEEVDEVDDISGCWCFLLSVVSLLFKDFDILMELFLLFRVCNSFDFIVTGAGRRCLFSLLSTIDVVLAPGV